MVADVLREMSMGRVAHVVYEKNEFVNVVHRLAWLGVRLEKTSKGGFISRHNSQSSLVLDMKSIKHIDTLKMELKE